MRQIPSEGEYCGECPHKPQDDNYSDRCGLFDALLEWRSTSEGDICYYRLPACLRDKPQVMTEEERLQLISVGYNAERPEKLSVTAIKLKKWQVDPESL